MIDGKIFESKKCPRCQTENFVRVSASDGPFIHNLELKKNDLLSVLMGSKEAISNLPCYLKLCTNCAYVETYSQKLVDEYYESLKLRKQVLADMLKKNPL